MHSVFKVWPTYVLRRLRDSAIARGRRFVWLCRFFITRLARCCRGLRILQAQAKLFENTKSPVAADTPEVITFHYINLDKRPDRKKEVLAEFTSLDGFVLRRFRAIDNKNGALGCALSHLQLLEQESGQARLLAVCEDDVEFLADSTQLSALIRDFEARPYLDVLCLAYNIYVRPKKVSRLLGITNDTTGTACYVVKSHAVTKLASAFRESVIALQNGLPRQQHAIDVKWKRLQQGELIFAVPITRAAKQRPSFSDIEGAYQDYGV